MKQFSLNLVPAAFVLIALLPLGCGAPQPGAGTAPAALPPAPPAARAPEGEPPLADPVQAAQEYGMDATPADGDWPLVHLPAEMDHLNPLTSSDAYASLVMDKVFDTLLDRDPVTLEMKPHLAESFEISEDKLVYTFNLRTDAIFSDGIALTAHDVKFTFDTLMNPATDAPHLRNYYKDVTACEVMGQYTVRFVCNMPYYRHLVMLGGLPVLPMHIYSRGDFNNHPNNRMPIGSGMYRLDRWDTGQQLVLVRNTNWWGKKQNGWPYYTEIIYKVINDPVAAFQVLNSGDLDTMNLRAEDWVRRANTARFVERFNKFAYYAPQYSYIGWNLRKPQFSDVQVRRALTMLLDRDTIRDTIYEGLARVITGNFMPGTPESDPDVAPWPFDPAEAARLLDGAGWTDHDGDGVRDKDGAAMRFEISTTNQNPVAEQILTIYKEELARAGIQMTLRLLEWATLIERVDKREFDAVMMGWSMPPDPDPYQVWHSSQTEAGSNYIGFVNAEADRIIEEARVNFNAEERAGLYRRFHRIIHDEQPYTFCFSRQTLLAVDKRVHGIRIYPFGPQDREWFTPAPLQRYGK